MKWGLTKAAATIAAFSVVLSSTAALADKGCKNVQSKCAIAIGGRCNPVTGRWEYGLRYKTGGNTLAFDNCIHRALSQESSEPPLESPGAGPRTKIVSIQSAATAQDCRALSGWGRYDCVAHNHPKKYIVCSQLATARGHGVLASGRASFILACIVRPRSVGVGDQKP